MRENELNEENTSEGCSGKRIRQPLPWSKIPFNFLSRIICDNLYIEKKEREQLFFMVCLVYV
jgi:hypothetical protein